MSRNRIPSLTNQGEQAIISCIALGESKRSDRRQQGGATDWKIFSVNHLTGLKTTNKDMMQYIHEIFPDCKRVKDVQPEMLQAWLEHKVESGASQEYVGKLVSHMRKLECCYRHKYAGIDMHLDRVQVPVCRIGGKQRGRVMDDETYTKLRQAMPKGTQAWKSVVLSHALGLRVAETAKIHAGSVELQGGRWGYGRAVLQGREDGCKGGRWRVIDILTAEDRDAIKSCLEGLQDDQTIISKADGSPYKVDSLQRAIDRAADKAGLTDWHQNKNHALRKHFAQESYNAIRISGGDKKQALGYVNMQLGHGHDRQSLNAVYVTDQW